MSDTTVTLAERYVLEARIASGGMASVWRARDDVLARTVAVKILHPHLAQDPSFIERFRVEALAAARLSHPNIVATYDTGAEGEGDEHRHYIVMEHCGGGTLQDMLITGSVSDPERVASIGATICEALAYAHRHEVIHRDIKPANVLISDHNTLKVTDFGIAKAAFAGNDLTTTGKIIGSVTYISPEQANGDEPDVRSDLYSLGVVLYELMVGRPPFKEETEVATALRHIHDLPPAPRSMRAGIPKDLEAIVMKSLAKNPDERFSSAEEMRSALGGGASQGSTQVLRTAPPSAPRSTPVTTGDDDRRRSPMSAEVRKLWPIIGLVALAIVAAIAIAGVLGEEPLGEQDVQDRSGGGSTRLDVRSAADFDPEGGDGEHPTEVPLAFDGNESTSWNTSNYSSPLSVLKDGVGLLFDLGESVEVGTVEVIFDRAGYAVEIRAADEAGSSADDFEVVADTGSSDATHAFSVGTTARYWLVWIKEFPGGSGGRGSISEVRFVGS